MLNMIDMADYHIQFFLPYKEKFDYNLNTRTIKPPMNYENYFT